MSRIQALGTWPASQDLIANGIFQQINHLAPLCNVTEIDILPDNPVIAVPLFHHYTLFRLNHLPLKKLSGKAVTNEDLGEAERKFGE